MKQAFLSVKARFPVAVPGWVLVILGMIEDVSLITVGGVAGLVAAHQTPDLVSQAASMAGGAMGVWVVLQIIIISIRGLTKEAD